MYLRRVCSVIIIAALTIGAAGCGAGNGNGAGGGTSSPGETSSVESSVAESSASDKSEDSAPDAGKADTADNAETVKEDGSESSQAAAQPASSTGNAVVSQVIWPEDIDTGYTVQADDTAPLPDLSNVINADEYSYCSDRFKSALAEHGFVVGYDGMNEFFDIYEDNRYLQRASFVTVDSMMHTYHLYFSHLQKQIEKKELRSLLTRLVEGMLEACVKQEFDMMLSSYMDEDTSKWFEAAQMNEVFFLVAARLLDNEYLISDGLMISEKAEEIADRELALVYNAEGIELSPLAGDALEMEDYTQYKPRGYYEGDTELESYFRAMMWLGRRNFSQDNNVADRAALLQVLAMAADDELLEDWNEIYKVTSLFAGNSDDSGYNEYAQAALEAYGTLNVNVISIVSATDDWNRFHELTGKLDPPQINSVPFMDDGGETDKTERAKGYRFMGQRFTIDGAIWQKLIYSQVKENSAGEKRMLPSGLDIPAAMGSDTALSILEEEGETDYEGYDRNLQGIRNALAESSDELWSASLYSSWLKTLRPLLAVKGEGYPFFMKDALWSDRQLETFMGSFMELKHDTVLYSKQVMAEMGGGWDEDKDYRGYVEPEPVVYLRLSNLVDNTRSMLGGYGLITAEDADDLDRLSYLAYQLKTISDKELKGELPTDEEFLLIEDYGGNLEHFWHEAMKADADKEYFSSEEFPAALITDVATDPDGSVLQIGNGRVSTIYVVVPVDGKLRIATGAVYNYYEFEQPMNDRLTDFEWRVMMGISPDENGEYHWYEQGEEPVQKPGWTTGYRRYYYEDDAALQTDTAQVILPQAEDDWEVQKTALLDLDRDGRKDLAALVWKNGSYGNHRPFWVSEDPPERSQHIFIYETDEDTGQAVRAKWMSSKLPAVVADMEATSAGLSVPEALLITLEDGSTSVWGWLSWGLERLDDTADHSEVTLVMAGDILLHTGVEQSAVRTVEDGKGKEGKIRDFNPIFAETADIISSADLALVNEEVIIGGEELGISGYPSFNAPREIGEALVDAGFDVILHATNHVLDKGKKGLINCMTYWDTAHPEIEYLGIHRDEADSRQLSFFTVNGITVAILNYTYGTNGIPLPPDMPYAVDLMDEKHRDRIAAQIDEARQNADFVIVCPHWGTEYTLEADDFQRRWNDFFLERGVDLVIGTHPHVIEPVEWAVDENTGRKMLTYYSLGNFVNWTSGQGSGVANRVVGGLARVTIGWNSDSSAAVIRNYDVKAIVCHLEEGYGGVRVFPLSDYTEELAARNRIITADPAFSRAYCTELCDRVWGSVWK